MQNSFLNNSNICTSRFQSHKLTLHPVLFGGEKGGGGKMSFELELIASMQIINVKILIACIK